MSENKDISAISSRDPVQSFVGLTTTPLQVDVKIEDVNPDGCIDMIGQPKVNVNKISTMCHTQLQVKLYRLPDFVLQRFIDDSYKTMHTPFTAEADLGLHSELDIKLEPEELDIKDEEASNCSEECVHAAAAAELAVCNNGSGSVKTEQLEQIIHEDEQNANSINKNKCTNAVDEDTTAATAGQTNTDSTSADFKLKRIVTADTNVHVKVEDTDMDRSSLLKSAINYTPRNEKTGLKCENKEINTGSNAPDAFKKNKNILLRCKLNKRIARTEQDTNHNSGTNLKNEFKCTLCNYTTNEAGAFEYHAQVHSNTTQYICNTCSYITVDKKSLIRHFKVHPEAFPLFRKTCINKSLDKHTVEKRCKFCGKGFAYSSHLTKHIRRHTGDKPYCCNICDKKFAQKGDLTRHITTHTGEKRFACKLCDKEFTRSGYLIQHIRRHTGDKIYCCYICDKKFAHNSDLTRHITSHTGEKRFACKFCDKGFALSCNLTKHIRTHTGEKPYACEICDKKFAQKTNLTTHIKTHTGEKNFACKFCDKKFAQKSNLTTHNKTHTRKKRFVCNLCNKEFVQSSTLIRHIRSHTGD